MTKRKKSCLKINTKNKVYGVQESPFFKLRSKKKLAELLGVTLPNLKSLSDDRNYNCFEDNASGKPRLIECPVGALETIHTRIASLICRIQQPDYMHSGIKTRSHISNARMHVGRFPVLVTDLQAFFPRTTAKAVFRFFYNILLCSPDVARLLSQVCTCNGHIPTGSRISMPLAFWANFSMFSQISALASSRDITMTVFVDDLTFSGNKVTRQFKQSVCKIITLHGHAMHPGKTFLYGPDATKVITGVAVSKLGLRVANRHHEAIHGDMGQWLAVRDANEMIPLKEQLTNRLLGRLNSQGQVDLRFKGKARSVKNWFGQR